MASQLRVIDEPSDQLADDDARPIRLLLADDHAQMRRSLRLLIESERGLDVVAEASDLSAVERQVREHMPQVLLLDLGIAGGSSIGHIRRLRRLAPATGIVVLTMEDDPIFARHALDAGASGFVLKEMADSDLQQAIRQAAAGMTYVSPRLRPRLAALGGSSADEKPTAREAEVLRLIALGHTGVEIAGRLGLSPRTVETHRARVQRKLGLKTRAELVRYALGHGLLDV